MKFIPRLLPLVVVMLASSVLAQSPEADALAVLKSDAARDKKTDACRELAHVGTQVAVAPLAALLGDDQLAHMARYGLENIPDPSAAAALRAALGQLKGKYLVGAIASLGVRRDAPSLSLLAQRLADETLRAPLSSPFAPEQIIVPAQGLAQWLKLELAQACAH